MLNRNDTNFLGVWVPFGVYCVKGYAHSDRNAIELKNQSGNFTITGTANLIPPGGLEPAAFFV